ncbi:LysR substrate-binding domain-containing protein [Sphingomonas sp. LB2R24]|uniref:LysR substrate-binding domain-containing protein n=1 Tax=Sphingomonas sorbitolis TaxID=3096165 RepID=UPI002FCBB40A
MPRHVNLRQIEAFKAVIENGTISRAAVMSNVSQPAMSKMIANLEMDTGLRLFDRIKGRLAPTENGMRLYDEVGRIFSGVRQVENAVEVIRREEQGRLAVGVLPALANTFIHRVTAGFLKARPNVFCSVQSLGSQYIVDWLIARRLDAGLVGAGYANPYVTLEPLMEHALVCVMPLDHPLAKLSLIEPRHLEGVPFVALSSDTYLGNRVGAMFEALDLEPSIVLVANTASMVCGFVAEGLGISLVHPLTVSGLEDRLTVRRFSHEIMYNFQLCRSTDSRNAKLVDSFAQELRDAAERISRLMLDI